MRYSYKFRAYPTKEQERVFEYAFEVETSLWNKVLKKKIKMMEKKEKYTKYDCLREYSRISSAIAYPAPTTLVAATINEVFSEIDACFVRKKKDNHVNLPGFKQRRDYPKTFSFYDAAPTTKKDGFGGVKIWEDLIKFPNMDEWLKCSISQKVTGRIKKVSITKTKSNKYYVTLIVDKEDIKQYEKTGKSVGIDLGIKNLATLSDGKIYHNPFFYKEEEENLKKLYKQLSKTTKGSRRYNQISNKIDRIYEKISNKRSDYFHKVTNEIVENYDIICIEDLCVSKMFKANRYIGKDLLDVGLRTFREILERKAEIRGKLVVVVDRNFPSSQKCSCCGYINPEVKNLGVREWDCPVCGNHHDRDLNAAINILNEGLRKIQ